MKCLLGELDSFKQYNEINSSHNNTNRLSVSLYRIDITAISGLIRFFIYNLDKREMVISFVS